LLEFVGPRYLPYVGELSHSASISLINNEQDSNASMS